MELLKFKQQIGAVSRLQVVDTSGCRFAVNVNHPVELLFWFSIDPADGKNGASPHRLFTGVELIAGILSCGQLQDVMRNGTVENLDTNRRRHASAIRVLVSFIKLQHHANADLQ